MPVATVPAALGKSVGLATTMTTRVALPTIVPSTEKTARSCRTESKVGEEAADRCSTIAGYGWSGVTGSSTVGASPPGG